MRRAALRPLWMIAFLIFGLSATGQAADTIQMLDPVQIEGLQESVRIRRDFNDVPHIFALNDHDAVLMLGYVHAQDRFFQMDVSRHLFSGTAAELFGVDALEQDVQLRTLGLRRAAEESLAALSAEDQMWLDAYAMGVNAYLGNTQNPLPVEYQVLELTRESIAPWTPLDSVVVMKGIAFGLSFDLEDIDYTLALLTFLGAGSGGGFDGAALFFEDLYRTAPFDPSISIPAASPLSAPETTDITPLLGQEQLPGYLSRKTLGLIETYRGAIEEVPVLKRALDRRDDPVGSNWWITGGDLTASGYPILAHDPHLALVTPATFYEAHLRVRTNGDPPMNVIGTTFPGTPAVVLGCNAWICWGATVNPLDVTDVYQESLVVDLTTGLPTHTVFEDTQEPLVLLQQSYMVNQIGNGTANDLVDAGLGPLDGGLTLVVPRRNNGPVVAIDASNPLDVTALSVQYTGWRATHEISTFRQFARARNIDDFKEALQSFDVGSQNWGYADIHGNIAYFTSAELPIREDLQNFGGPAAGVPPYIVRDGTHTLPHEWLPVQNPQPGQALGFEILPFAEMPQTANPPQGYILNANNDPIGTSLDNVPFNQLRDGGGLLYLSPGYATGFRMGRLQRLYDAALATGQKLDVDKIKEFQHNNQLLDAEVLVPYILTAFANASAAGAPAELAALAADAGVAEAVNRLAAWDFSTPTGIEQGFDPGDDPQNLPAPDQEEIAASVAATIYSMWRGQVVRAVVDGPLTALGLDALGPSSSQSMTALRNLLDNFDVQQGIGASGLNFFAVDGLDDPAASRDFKILDSLRSALERLASDDLAPAFGGSTDQDDYRWGMLHRIVFEHPIGGPFNVPAAGGPGNVSDLLAGIARSGGFGALDASSHGSRADEVDDFMFGSGPARRFVGHMTPQGIDAVEVIPGGESGEPGSPFQIDQLLLWLTNQHHPLPIVPDAVIGHSRTFQRFLPAN